MSSSISRRGFLKLSGGAVAGAGVAVAGIGNAQAAQTDVGNVALPYKAKVVAHANSLKENVPVNFSFPDASSPCALIKTGTRISGGVGPDEDIVAYSTLCSHMVCPVSYDSQARVFKCPCHYSMFDPEKSGQMVCGQATKDLPRIVLQHDAKTDIVTAVGVEGLIYGRQANIL